MDLVQAICACYVRPRVSRTETEKSGAECGIICQRCFFATLPKPSDKKKSVRGQLVAVKRRQEEESLLGK